jgi:hypothetical protein
MIEGAIIAAMEQLLYTFSTRTYGDAASWTEYGAQYRERLGLVGVARIEHC